MDRNLNSLLEILIDNIPALLLFLAAVGLLKAANGALHLLTAKIRAHVKGTPSKLDDALVLPVLEKLDALGDDLQDGRIDGPAAAKQAKALAEKLRAKR